MSVHAPVRVHRRKKGGSVLLAEALKVVDLLGGTHKERHALVHRLWAHLQNALSACGSLAASLPAHPQF